jgi:hypothetical protein
LATRNYARKLGHGDKEVPILESQMMEALGYGDKEGADFVQLQMVKALGHVDKKVPILLLQMMKARPWRQESADFVQLQMVKVRPWRQESADFAVADDESSAMAARKCRFLCSCRW